MGGPPPFYIHSVWPTVLGSENRHNGHGMDDQSAVDRSTGTVTHPGYASSYSSVTGPRLVQLGPRVLKL